MAIAGVTDYTNTYAANRTSYNAKGSSGLSETAQSYLSDLKQKYSDVNITVADFNSEKQSDAYMLGSRGYNNVAISASVVERMATDPQTAEKYEKVVSDMSGNAERIIMMRFLVQVLSLTKMEKCRIGWLAGVRIRMKIPVLCIKKRYKSS